MAENAHFATSSDNIVRDFFSLVDRSAILGVRAVSVIKNNYIVDDRSLHGDSAGSRNLG